VPGPSQGRSRRQRRARLLFEEHPERRRLEQATPDAVGQLELLEDLARLWCPRRLTRFPLAAEPVAQLLEAVDGVEDAPDDELRRGDTVPAVLL
jgi:hypothetical protein